MEEVWKDVLGYEGMYQVSDLGRVRSLDRHTTNGRFLKGRLMKQRLNQGYLKVKLCKNNKHECRSVHRLVAFAFISNPNNYPVINHKNEIKTDNRVMNLEWCTVKYNTNYGSAIERRSSAIRGKVNKSKNCKVVYQYSNTGELLQRFPSIGEASRKLGVRKSTLQQILSGNRVQRKEYVLSVEPIKSENIRLHLRRALEQPKQRKQVYCYTNDRVLIDVYPSVKEASRILGISDSYIVGICKMKVNQRHDYILSYVPLS